MPGYTDTPDFTTIVLPDMQTITELYPEKLTAVANWIVANKSTYNIGAVVEVGDMVEHATIATEWERADAFYDTLGAASIPHIKGCGNHEYSVPDGESHSNPVMFNTYFPPTRYTSQSWWNGGFYETGKSQNAYLIVGKYLFLVMEFGPRQEVIDWAKTIVAANPTKLVIIISHAIEYKESARFDTSTDGMSAADYVAPHPEAHCGDEIWAELGKLYSNIRLMVSGHYIPTSGASRHSETGDNSNPVESMIANWQGTQPWIRVLKFYDSQNYIHVRTYDPSTSTWLTDADNDFRLTIT